ncbi:hypothetical protein IGB42_04011 [Andreprevotia sp. IGB-42]|nr:hypothetical protein IGB42_04011 [Andreprevotia sp. IGB-42]
MPPVDAATLQKQQINAAVQSWATAWSQKDVDNYLAAYSTHFRAPVGKTAAGWAAERRARLSVPKSISVSLGDIKVSEASAGLMQAQFQQRYQSDLLSDVTDKTLLLEKSGERWLIVEERAGS